MTRLKLITGFLGSGKTTYLKKQLKEKPQAERWFFLLNDSGPETIDGDLLKEQGSLADVLSLAGGCICCTNQVAVSLTLMEILSTENPDVVWIEPSGLANPKDLLQILSSIQKQNQFELDPIIGFFDSRRLLENRFFSMPLIQSQLAISNILIFNFADLLSSEEKMQIKEVQRLYESKGKQVFLSQHSRWDQDSMQLNHFCESQGGEKGVAPFLETQLEVDLGAENKIQFLPKGEDLTSRSYSFSWDSDFYFNHEKLINFFSQTLLDLKIPLIRAKGVLQTQRGWQSIQWSGSFGDPTKNFLEVKDYDYKREESALNLILESSAFTEAQLRTYFESLI